MRRIPLLLAAAALLTGCADYGAPGGASDGGAGSATARFVPGNDVNIIQVTLTGRLPARAAELVGPDGTVQPAQSINTDRVASRGYGYGGPTFGLGVGGGSGGFGSGIGLSFPLGSSSETVSSGDIVSNAFIPLPDPLRYRQTWQAWRIRVQVGDPPNQSTLELAAPQPPA
jgi:hypothetical protein